MFAAIFNLNHHAGYVHWHFFEMSWPNIIVIVLMVVVFFGAIFLRFPHIAEVPPDRTEGGAG